MRPCDHAVTSPAPEASIQPRTRRRRMLLAARPDRVDRIGSSEDPQRAADPARGRCPLPRCTSLLGHGARRRRRGHRRAPLGSRSVRSTRSATREPVGSRSPGGTAIPGTATRCQMPDAPGAADDPATAAHNGTHFELRLGGRTACCRRSCPPLMRHALCSHSDTSRSLAMVSSGPLVGCSRMQPGTTT